MLKISHCNYRRHILQNHNHKHKRYQMNLNSHYKKSLFVSWNFNIQQMFFPHYIITITDSGLRLNNASEKA